MQTSACLGSVWACPCLVHLPAQLSARVGSLALAGQRHYALNMVAKHVTEQRAQGHMCREIPYIVDIRPRDSFFCCRCDSDVHSCTPPLLKQSKCRA